MYLKKTLDPTTDVMFQQDLFLIPDNPDSCFAAAIPMVPMIVVMMCLLVFLGMLRAYWTQTRPLRPNMSSFELTEKPSSH